MAKGFTLDDIIEYEVEKRIKKKAEGGGAESMIEEHIGKFLKNPKKYIKMIKEIQEMSQSLQGEQGDNQKSRSVEQPQNQTQTPQPNNEDGGNTITLDTMISGIDKAITLIINQYGDIPVSSLQKTLRENPEAVKSMIEAYMEGEK